MGIPYIGIPLLGIRPRILDGLLLQSGSLRYRIPKRRFNPNNTFTKSVSTQIPQCAYDMRPSKGVAALSEPSISSSKFRGYVIEFANGSRWRLLKALSHIKLQQEHAPCESLTKHPKCRNQTIEELNYNKYALLLCTNPTLTPGLMAANQIHTPNQIVARQFYSAPWLLEVSMIPSRRRDLYPGITGGHFVFMLMFKLPVCCLIYNYLHTLSPIERQEIRDAFRLALL